MEKHKINLDRPIVSAEEIKAKENFDQVINNYHVTPRSILQKGWFWGSVGMASLAAITVFTFTSVNHSNEEKEKVATATENNELPPDTPCIKPPSEHYQNEYQVFTFDPKHDTIFVTRNGSKIEVSAHSFKDENGAIIQNAVEIQIREYYDKSEVFLAGVPMSYDSLGGQFSLETAGMIEIRGFNSGKAIQEIVNPLKIDLATNNSDENFNLYYLDEAAKNWDYLSVLNPTSKNVEIKDLKEPGFYKNEEKSIQSKINLVKSEIKTLQKTKPIEPRKLDENKFSFDIDANTNQFPELAAFKNIIFEVSDENKGFSKKVYEQTWEDLELIKLDGKYQVQLTKGSRVEKYIVVPCLSGSEYTNAKSQFDSKFALYSEKKNEKDTKLKNYENELAENKKLYSKALEYSKVQEFNHNTKEEKNPSVSYKSIVSNQEMVQRIFTVGKFGVYNCDRKVKFPNQENIMAHFVREDGTNIQNLHNVNLISSEKNTVYNYQKADLVHFGFNPKHENKIWLVDELGEIYACGNDEFNKIQLKSGVHKFVMRKLPKFETVEEFNNLTSKIES